MSIVDAGLTVKYEWHSYEEQEWKHVESRVVITRINCSCASAAIVLSIVKGNPAIERMQECTLYVRMSQILTCPSNPEVAM